MFNVTVLKMKDILKYILGVCLIIAVLMTMAKIFSKKSSQENKTQSKLRIFSSGGLTSCLDSTIPSIEVVNKEYNEIEEENTEINQGNYPEQFLKTEISSIKAIEEIEKDSKIKENKEENNKEVTKEEMTLASTSGVQSEVVTQNPIANKYNAQYGKVQIKNQTTFALTEEMLKPDIIINNKNVLIFHTHSCESYTSSEKYPYVATGNFRTTDLNYTVTRVGTELENYLKQYQFNVVHNTSYHDYPAYNGSYTRSLQTVENMLKTTQADIIIDLHRDAIGSRADYAPTVKIGDEYAAQIMFVIGTNEGGLLHPNWNQNLKFAIKVQQKAEEMYPGLFKPITLTTSRYNQHTGKYANIIEVGATGNTMEQCLNSMKYLSAVFNEIAKE
ncbi:MAG: stage II sporulation protein P [Clostridia bacterium]|nr:stage II sporulation protein P [Clostridia bacterium]